jgi:hypothetical protein
MVRITAVLNRCRLLDNNFILFSHTTICHTTPEISDLAIHPFSFSAGLAVGVNGNKIMSAASMPASEKKKDYIASPLLQLIRVCRCSSSLQTLSLTSTVGYRFTLAGLGNHESFGPP